MLPLPNKHQIMTVEHNYCSIWLQCIYNNYSLSPSWIWSDKITKLVILTSYPTRANGIIVLVNSQTGFCADFYFHNFTKRPERKFLNLAHYFPYDVKLRLLAHSRSVLTNQEARNAIVRAENLLNCYILFSFFYMLITVYIIVIINRLHDAPMIQWRENE